MDYEKKYKEALERARALRNEAIEKEYVDDYIKDYETIFPELRESEDEYERIRKMCIAAVNIAASADGGLLHSEASECLSWLEEQKDKNCLACDQHLKGYLAGRKTTEAEKQKEIPMPNSTTLLKMWDDEEKMLREKGIDDMWRLAYNAFLDGFAQGMMVKQKEQKSIGGIYWHAIKKGEKLPCRAYIWNPDYEKYHDCWEGRLIPNLEKICVGADTWYLPAKDVRDLPREGVDELPEEQKPELYDMGRWDEESYNNGIFHVLKNPEIYGLTKKPNIELIQRSWYMEGYHDRDFGKEPMWIIKTGEGGPKHEPNPKYGQLLDDEQKPAEEQDYSGLTDLERAIHRGFLSAGVENVPVTIIKETAKDCLAHMPAEWSEEDEKMIDTIVSVLGQYIDYKAVFGTGSGYATPRYSKEIAWLKSLRPQPHWKPSEEQMENLEMFFTPSGVMPDFCVLESLYNDLKELI